MSEPEPDGTIEADLVAWGKAIALQTTGRRSGRPRRVIIGFVESDGGLLVASASASTHWARNLQAQPRCHVQLHAQRRTYRAAPLAGAARDAAVSALILKYGTPAERLGGGLAFRLEPA